MDDLHWRTRIKAAFASEAQKDHRAQAAVKALDDALVVLASLGFPLHAEEGLEPVEREEWPRYLFHLRLGPRVCNCEADWKEWGPDWYLSMDEARQRAGEAKQWQRGGVFSKSLPARLDLQEAARAFEVTKPSRNQLAASLRPARYPVPALRVVSDGQ